MQHESQRAKCRCDGSYSRTRTWCSSLPIQKPDSSQAPVKALVFASSSSLSSVGVGAEILHDVLWSLDVQLSNQDNSDRLMDGLSLHRIPLPSSVMRTILNI